MFDTTKIFRNLSKEEKNNLEIFCQEKSLKAGESLFKEDDEANAMYILQEGEIAVYKNIDGKNNLLGNILAEDILGEMAVFGERGKRMASAKAVKDSVLIVLLSFSIKELTNKYPEIMNKIKNIIEIRNIQNKNK
ncbi:MAG: cyclic nucleotide-binding domain-containing protein [Candidatus Gracilibacteria bacterium]|nr:cyclic nucleotide-binding domain-containing protein [Candidatus Gracilibacteria bacterium]MDQ7022740.1 cyclic nucleotide-binding domain-containing protein [Candidatus Gracilibacteria bacterium]